MNWTEIIIAGVMGYTWSQILTRDGMVFGWWPGFVDRITGLGEVFTDTLGYTYTKYPSRAWIRKPLYECPACVTGFWYTVWLVFHGIFFGFTTSMIPHLFAAIFIADVLAKKL